MHSNKLVDCSQKKEEKGGQSVDEGILVGSSDQFKRHDWQLLKMAPNIPDPVCHTLSLSIDKACNYDGTPPAFVRMGCIAHVESSLIITMSRILWPQQWPLSAAAAAEQGAALLLASEQSAPCFLRAT